MEPIFSADEPVYILGGGASLVNLDWDALKGRQSIAVNLAYLKLPSASAMFFGDDLFLDRWKDATDPRGDFRRFHGGPIYSTAPGLKDAPRPRITYVRPTRLAVTNGRKRVSVTKGTSGMQAIGLAFALGARSIVLLGFDGTPGHWADGTPYAHPTSPPGPELLARATRRLTTLARLGLPITVAGPNPIEGFAHDPMPELFHQPIIS